MTTSVSGDLCRVTVVGPEKKVDLAVPPTTTVAALLPVLLWHTTGQNGSTDMYRPDGAWVIQRLGGAPFDPNGTPESLDWLEGEELYLRPTEDPLPELDFDDLADGIATVVNRRRDRWQPEYRRYLFLGLSAVALAAFGAVVVDRGALAVQHGVGIAAVVLSLLVAVLAARAFADRALSLLFALAACGFAGLTAVNWVDGSPDDLVLSRPGVIVGSAAVAGVALIVAVAHRYWERGLPYASMLALLVAAVTTISVPWMRIGMGLSAPAAAGTAAAVLVTVVIFAPKLVLRLARLRGPQLPKTGEELQFDNQPEPADGVSTRANEADVYLSVAMVCVSLVLPFLLQTVLKQPGWLGWTYVSTVVAIVLLRSRTFFGVWQRVPLVASGSAGVVTLILLTSSTVSAAWRTALLCGLAVLVAALVFAAIRPWPRRLLPIWEFTALVFDVITGLTLLPLLLHLLGVYGWARGLFG